ncbi:MAG: cysteine desulfurase family protein [Candidatus Nanopelagicaceae bacterium]|nr:cysteine desulfurase family protein [Candidatus Nanopelagicaceae bacterium]
MSIYLDHAATTPMVDVAIETMTSQMKKLGNPSSLHTHGRAVRKEIEEAREVIASAVGSLPSEIIFTGSGTEANNTALKGLFWAGQTIGRNIIVISAIEHHAILDPAQWLVEHEGAELITIGVDSNGVLNIGELTNLISARGDEIAVISVMASNNETGVIQPIADVVELAKINSIPVHCDAVQSFGKVPLSFSELGLTALTISAHKVGGPFGIGVLVLRRAVEIPALLHGGGQERELRSGTLNAPSILAFSAAVKESVETFEVRNFRVEQIRDDFAQRILEVIPDAYINGVEVARIPGIINVTFPGTESDTLLLLLDAEGISCSTGSACSAGVHRPSHVLLAMGHTEKSAMSTLRFSLGATTTFDEIDETLRVLPSVIERGRVANLR